MLSVRRLGLLGLGMGIMGMRILRMIELGMELGGL